MKPQNDPQSHVYQSGEKVNIPGIYELAATHDCSPAQRLCIQLRHGDCFPDHQGRAACWHLLEAIEYHEMPAPIHAPWQQ